MPTKSSAAIDAALSRQGGPSPLLARPEPGLRGGRALPVARAVECPHALGERLNSGLWRQVLDYFDAFIIGLTATPNKQTFGFFDQKLVRPLVVRFSFCGWVLWVCGVCGFGGWWCPVVGLLGGLRGGLVCRWDGCFAVGL